MKTNPKNQLAEDELVLKHWYFIENLLRKTVAIYSTDGDEEKLWEFYKTLYVEAMLHGIKHGKELLGE